MNFKDILWMPVDIPKFDRCSELVDDFTIDFDQRNVDYDVRGQLFLHKKTNYEISTPKDDLTSSQLAVIEYCKKYLPFTDYINIKIHHIQSTGMVMHIDFGDQTKNPELYKHTQEHEPCGFRMVIQGTKSGDMAINNNDELIVPDMPEDTDWYLISHTGTLHGTPSNVDNIKDRYVLFVQGWVDKEKHNELISKSIVKYKDLIVKK
tara:strand:- start:293 stop:910 length:618 start_codon:yes stop_codon:yes gene_type:complete